MKIFQLLGALSGKKTAIGATLLTVAVTLEGLKPIWPEYLSAIDPVITGLEWVGGFLAGVGVTHKAVKGELTQKT